MPTQAQASEMVCPYQLGRQATRSQFEHDATRQKMCWTSKCMAWRWIDGANKPHVIRCVDRGAEVEPDPRPRHVPIEYLWVPANAEDDAGWERPLGDDADRRGFCGMAGPIGQFDR